MGDPRRNHENTCLRKPGPGHTTGPVSCSPSHRHSVLFPDSPQEGQKLLASRGMRKRGEATMPPLPGCSGLEQVRVDMGGVGARLYHLRNDLTTSWVFNQARTSPQE